MKRRSNIRPELRQNIINGEWIIIAPGRSTRPVFFRHASKEGQLARRLCPFDDPQKSDNREPHRWYTARGEGKGKVKNDWTVQIVANKYPALETDVHVCPESFSDGFYHTMSASGFHDVVIYRGHSRFLADMSVSEIDMILRAYQDQFNYYKREACVQYIFIFHNHGQAAGASIWHPHSQIMALPFIPRDINVSLNGSKIYWLEKGTCVHCAIIAREMKEERRIICENRNFVAFIPFAPHVNYEIHIFPKAHSSHFELVSAKNRAAFAEIFSVCLRKLKKALGNPAYNFFIHTAPTGAGVYDFYHWHMELLPKSGSRAGAELGIGVELLTVTPEESAEVLRGA